MNLAYQLKMFLGIFFDGLNLKRSLFYSGIPALRFDLQDESAEPPDNRYFEKVLKRMSAIHDEVFVADEYVWLIYQKDTRKREKIRKRGGIFNYINLNTANFQFKRNSKAIYSYQGDKNDKAQHSCQLIIIDKAKNIDFNGLFSSIANKDFNRKSILDGDLYMLWPEKQIIVCMYDDRGCDIISEDLALLRFYYHKLSSLILEYDRKEILKVLESANN